MLKLVLEEGSALREVDETRPRARQVLSRHSSLSAPQLGHTQGYLGSILHYLYMGIRTLVQVLQKERRPCDLRVQPTLSIIHGL